MIALFPGHVGKDPGAVDGFANNDKLYTVESVLSYAISSKVALFLKMLGIKYIEATGKFDARIAKTVGCEVGVSIHIDISETPSVYGYHCIYHQGSEGGKTLAGNLDSALKQASHRARLIHSRRDLAILKQTSFPCVLVECGFLSNTLDEAHLYTEGYQYSIAFAIVSGLLSWRHNNL